MGKGSPESQIDALRIRCKATEDELAKAVAAIMKAHGVFLQLEARLNLMERHVANVLRTVYGPSPGEIALAQEAAAKAQAEAAGSNGTAQPAPTSDPEPPIAPQPGEPQRVHPPLVGADGRSPLASSRP